MVLDRLFSVVLVIVSLEVHEFGCMTSFSVWFCQRRLSRRYFLPFSLLAFDAYAHSDYPKIASLFLHPQGLWSSSLIPLVGWPESSNTCDLGFCCLLQSVYGCLLRWKHWNFIRPVNLENPGRLDLLQPGHLENPGRLDLLRPGDSDNHGKSRRQIILTELSILVTSTHHGGQIGTPRSCAMWALLAEVMDGTIMGLHR